MSAATAGSVCLANPAFLPFPIDQKARENLFTRRGQSSIRRVRINRNHHLDLPKFVAYQNIFRNSRTSLLDGLIIEPSVAYTPDVVLSSTGRATLVLTEEFPL